ncbi:MAG: hypothetical protein BRD47_01710 [Bacteroidetes bacterium QS_8_68_28]|nr:MAG: hypothetical protein BRD47_01710 [Bacteroidetes bacterium QS_8_68_28]
MPARSPSVFFVVGGALAGLLLALGGCNAGGSAGGTQAEVTRRVQRGVTPGQRSLVFDHYSGDVTLRDTAAREADLTFVKHARAASREAARKLLSRIRIEERGGSGEFAYKITSGAAARTSVDVQGRVSRKTRLRLYLRDGDLALSGLRGPLDATNENGNVRIGGAAQSVRAETRNGAVEVGMRRVPPEGEVRLKTQNGDLRLTLPASASADVAARTDAGDIDVGRDLNFSDRERDAGGAGGRFEGELGEGGARVRLRTANGDITLRRGTVRRLPGLGRPSPPRDTTQRDTTQRDTARRDSLPTPPMLRRPDAQQDDDAGAAGADTGDTAAPMLPGRDTTQQ